MFLKTSRSSSVLIVAISVLSFRVRDRVSRPRSASAASAAGLRCRLGAGASSAVAGAGVVLGGLGRRCLGVGRRCFGRRRLGRRVGREALAALDPLVDQGLDAVGHVAGEGRNRPAALTIGAWNPPARRARSTSRGAHVGERGDVGGAEHVGAEQAALHDQGGVGPAEVAQGLGRDDRVALDERDRRGALEHRHELGEPGLLGGPAGQRVLEDLEVGTGRAQRAAELGELAHLEPAVLGQHRGVRFRESLTDLGDHRHLLGSGHDA